MQKFLSLIAMLACSVHADTLISYDDLYNKMTKLQQPEYSDITLAFVLSSKQSDQACRYVDFSLKSDIHHIPLTLSARGEISLPYDEALKDSKALLVLQQVDNQQPCQLTLLLRSRMRLPSTLTQKQLTHYRGQFESLLHDFAGISKRWMPQISGVTLQFDNNNPHPDLTPAQQALTECSAMRCTLNLTNYKADDAEQWRFSQRPLYLMPALQQE